MIAHRPAFIDAPGAVSLRRPPPVDPQRGSGNEGRHVRGEKNDGTHQFLDLAGAAQLDLVLDPRAPLRGLKGGAGQVSQDDRLLATLLGLRPGTGRPPD
jgi:hypothetical protein